MDMTRRSLAVGLVVLLVSILAPAVATEAADSERGRADWLYQAGVAAFEDARYWSAISFFEEALPLYRALGSRWYEASILTYLGLCYVVLSDFQRSIGYYEQSLAIAVATEDQQGEARNLNNLGICYHHLGDYWKAIEYHERSLEISREVGDWHLEAASLGNLGLHYESMGDYRMAIDCHELSLRIDREHGERLGEAMNLNNLGLCYRYLGDYQKAIDLHEHSFAVLWEIGNRRLAAMSLANLGLCYESLSDYRRAIEYYEQALPIFEAVGDRESAARGLGILGSFYYSLGDYARAIDIHQESLTIRMEVQDRAGAAESLNSLGRCYIALGSFRNASEIYGQSLGICREIGDGPSEARSLRGLGDCSYWLGNYQEAVDYYTQGLAAVETITASDEYATGAPETFWRLQDGLGLSYRALSNLAPAAAAWREAVRVIEEMRGRVGRATLTSSFMGGKLSVYGRLVPALLDIGQLEEGAAYVERAKARTLVDMMETTMLTLPAILPHLVQSGSDTIDELNALTAGAVGGEELMATRSSAQAAAQRTQAEYDAFLAELESENPALGDTLSVNAERLAMYCQDVTGKLAESAVALEYFVTDAETILWVITEDGIQTASRIVVSRDDLAQAVRSFRDVVQAPPLDPQYPVLSYHKILQQAKPLYDLLVAPVEEYLAGVEHLVIIPSDVLFYVPFATLYQCPDETDLYKETVARCAGGADGSQPTGRFLIERFTLSYAPSLASLYWPLQHEGDGTYTSILSVGNPTGDLLAAQTEATRVAWLFPDATLLLREGGTEAKVKQELAARGYDVVHLSTHGLFDPAMPLLSEVVFREGGGEDGHLYAGEILGLSLSHTELVVMSACQTALPPEIRQDVVVGDEIQGLGQALFVAGVPTALLTLWNVNDASTGELMVEFYQELMSGQAKAESLAEAQRALLNGDHGLSYRHPYYWAPFVMYGEWR